MKNNDNKIFKTDDLVDYSQFFSETISQKNQEGKVVSKILFKNKFFLFLSIFLFILKYSPVIILPIITSKIIDEVASPSGATMTNILTYSIIMLILITLNLPITIIANKLNNTVLRLSNANIRATVIRKLQHLSFTYHKDIESGRLQSKFLTDTETIDQYFNLIINTIIPAIVLIIINTFITAYNSFIVLGFIIIVVPINLTLIRFFRKHIRNFNRSFRLQKEETSSKLTQMLEMLEVTKAHGLEEIEISKIENEIKKLTKVGLKLDSVNSSFGAGAWIIPTIFSFLCLIFTSIMTIKGVDGFTVGSIMLYQSMYSSIITHVSQLINSMPQISRGKEAMHSISEIMNSNDIEDNFGKINIQKADGSFEFKNVSYKYPNTNEYVIKNFNLSVKKGECIAFVGKSGSGKTTIMNMVIGFLKPSEGEMLIDGKSVNDINVCEYRHSISVVPQNSILFDGTIRENITYGLTKYTEEDVQRVVEQANILEFLKDIPEGLNFNIGEHGAKLSGGQRQRISIARALIRNPSIIILDEATSALDNVSEYHVQQAIERVIKDKTTFIVAHRLSTIRNADRIVVMDDGKIVESGTYEELINLKGKFYELKTLNELTDKKASQLLENL